MARRPPTKKKKSARAKAGKILWGRPCTYNDPKEFDQACQKYFSSLKWDAPNLAGLLLAIGISSRQTWANYKKRQEFLDTIRNVEHAIESYWVGRLKYPGAGAIFYLKNFRPDEYKDRTPGDAENPFTMQITGMKITRDKKQS